MVMNERRKGRGDKGTRRDLKGSEGKGKKNR